MDLLLFCEHMDDPVLLRKTLDALIQDTLQMSHKKIPIEQEHWFPIAKAFGNSAVVNPPTEIRLAVNERLLGAYIDEVQSREKYLSEEQKELIQLRIGGFPRVIRGVAGSGKTVVLAALVARYLHRHLPDQSTRVAVTCFNRMLVPFLWNRVEAAWQEYGHDEPLPENALTLTHVNQLIWLLGRQGWPVQYIRTGVVRDDIKRAQLYRNQIAQFARAQPERYQSLCFDAIFLDEAQDFAPEEIALLLDLLKPHPETGEKNLTLCYDDTQNLYGRQRLVWKDLGINVAIGDRSRVMRHCFRNSRQTVELAFNVLIGTQAPPDLRVHTRQYADVAYLREHDLITEGVDGFRIHFADRDDALSVVQRFPLRHAELDWVVAQIVQLVGEEAVRPEDILLLASKPSTPALALDYLERHLHAKLPATPLYFAATPENKDQPFFAADRLIFSTVYSAKGYDAAVVFVLGTDLFPYTNDYADFLFLMLHFTW